MKGKLLLISFTFLALFLRLYVYKALPEESSVTLFSDDAIYMNMARSINDGDILRAIHPVWLPALPALAALTFLITGNYPTAGLVINIILGSFLIVPIYFIVNKLRGSVLYSLAFTPTYFLFVESSLTKLTEPSFALAIWSGIYFAIRGLKNRDYKSFYFSGIAFSLGALTRSEGTLGFLLTVAYLVLLAIVLTIRRNRKLAKIYLQACMAFVLAFLILYLPYQVAIYKKYGTSLSFAKAVAIMRMSSHFTMTSDGASTWIQDLVHLDTFNTESEYLSEPDKFIKDRYTTVLSDWKIRNLWSAKYLIQSFAFINVLLFIFGVIHIVHAPDKTSKLFIVYFSFSSIILTMLFSGTATERYLIWSVPGFVILSSLGVSFLATKIRQRWLGALLTVIISLYVGADNISFYRGLEEKYNVSNYSSFSIQNDSDFVELVKARRVMVRHEGYLFNANSYIIYTPNTVDLKSLVDYGDLWGAEYLLATLGEVHNTVDFLYKEPRDYEGLKLVFSKPDKNLYVYELQ